MLAPPRRIRYRPWHRRIEPGNRRRDQRGPRLAIPRAGCRSRPAGNIASLWIAPDASSSAHQLKLTAAGGSPIIGDLLCGTRDAADTATGCGGA